MEPPHRPPTPAVIADPQYLCACVRSLWHAFRTECERSGVAVTLVETIRTPARQQFALEVGITRARTSRHLPQAPRGAALAFDAVPSAYHPLKFWAPRGVYWRRLGVIASDLGLDWGGAWRHRDGWTDPSHFELLACSCPEV